jgi:serine O-acetyltransferase
MLFKRLQEDLDAFLARDPAARSRLEIALCYPGFHALLFFRASKTLWRRRLFLTARMVSHLGRLATGIEIHPGARIGRRFVIDHGTGVVIGETAEIDDDVTLYQGVTLGGIAPSVDSRSQVSVKRHPTLKAGVIVGSGAQILGAITVGDQARVGANSVVTRDVPPGVTVVGIPAHVVIPRDQGACERFSAYGTPAGGCPDPVLASVEALRGQLSALVDRIDAMEGELDALRAGQRKRVNGSGETVEDVSDAAAPVAAEKVDGGERARH